MTAQPPTDPRDKIQVFKTTGLWAEAVDVLLGLLGESPEDPDLHAELAQCLLECGDRDVDASKAAGEALRIDERHVLGHVYKALVMERLGYVPRATQHLRQALEVDPDHELARRELERIDGPQESGGGLLDRFFKKK